MGTSTAPSPAASHHGAHFHAFAALERALHHSHPRSPPCREQPSLKAYPRADPASFAERKEHHIPLVPTDTVALAQRKGLSRRTTRSGNRSNSNSNGDCDDGADGHLGCGLPWVGNMAMAAHKFLCGSHSLSSGFRERRKSSTPSTPSIKLPNNDRPDRLLQLPRGPKHPHPHPHTHSEGHALLSHRHPDPGFHSPFHQLSADKDILAEAIASSRAPEVAPGSFNAEWVGRPSVEGDRDREERAEKEEGELVEREDEGNATDTDAWSVVENEVEEGLVVAV